MKEEIRIMKVLIIIPAYNEELNILKLIDIYDKMTLRIIQIMIM